MGQVLVYGVLLRYVRFRSPGELRLCKKEKMFKRLYLYNFVNPSSLATRVKASKTFLYPLLSAAAFIESACILTKATSKGVPRQTARDPLPIPLIRKI